MTLDAVLRGGGGVGWGRKDFVGGPRQGKVFGGPEARAQGADYGLRTTLMQRSRLCLKSS